jgi:hypothetical protein
MWTQPGIMSLRLFWSLSLPHWHIGFWYIRWPTVGVGSDHGQL